MKGCAGYADFEFRLLQFPIADTASLTRIAAFGIPNWSGSEPHNGIDLVVDESLETVGVSSPTAGTVTSIRASENPFSNPPGQLLLTIEIRVNAEWTVSLVLEPSTVDGAVRTAQLEAVQVIEGEVVDAGGPVADLLVGTLGYPHLHYMVLRFGEPVCAFEHSTDEARAVFSALGEAPNSNLPDGNVCYGAP